MHPQTLLFLLNVTVDVLVPILVQVLAQQVEAVQLVEHLDRRTVALFARRRVRDFKRVPGEA